MQIHFALIALPLALIFFPADAVDISKSETTDQKQQYCRDNQYSCGVFCAGNVRDNQCHVDSLMWSCLCGNGRFPDKSPYEFPIAIHQCEAELLECVDACLKKNPADNGCTATCKNLKHCATLNARQTTSFRMNNVDKDSSHGNDHESIGNTTDVAQLTILTLTLWLAFV